MNICIHRNTGGVWKFNVIFLIKDDNNGFIVGVGDIDTISSKIDFFNKNRDELTRMGQNSFDIVENWNFIEDVKGIGQAIGHVTGKKINEESF